jgi:hypothetical protein
VKFEEIISSAKNVLRNTAIEVALGATLIGGAGTAIMYNHEAASAKRVALSFSEVGQLIRENEYQGKGISPTNMYIPLVNDFCMKNFEVWNDANNYLTFNQDWFAHYLEVKQGQDAYRYDLNDLRELIPQYGDTVLEQSLQEYSQLKKETQPVEKNLDAAWNYRTRDNYHTEIRTRQNCSTNSEGNTTCTTETYTVQVYDDTDHYWDYFATPGKQSAKQLEKLLTEFPKLEFPDNVLTATQTNADGEYAAEKSRTPLGKGTITLSPEELLDISKIWHKGSTLLYDKEMAEIHHRELHKYGGQWIALESQAESVYDNTTRRKESGPKTYRMNEQSLHASQGIIHHISSMENLIQYNKEEIEAISTLGDSLIQEHYFGDKGHARDLIEEYHDRTISLYETNFHNAPPVEKYNPWAVAGVGFLSALLGIGIGMGVEELSTEHNWWGSKRKQRQPQTTYNRFKKAHRHNRKKYTNLKNK